MLFGIALGAAKQVLGTPQPLGTSQLAFPRALQKKTVDGALLAGPRTGKEYAKFALKKGLPTDDRRPHAWPLRMRLTPWTTFNGVIEEGYGKAKRGLSTQAQASSRLAEVASLGRSMFTHTMPTRQASTMTSLPKELTHTRSPLRLISPTVSSRDAMPSGKPSRRTAIWLSA